MLKRRGTVCFFTKEDRVLLFLLQYPNGKKIWNGLGGFVEDGETLQEGLAREIEEEIKIIVDKTRLVEKTVRHYPEVELHVFIYDGWDLEPKPIDPTILEWRWFEKSSLPFDQMHQDNQSWLPKILKKTERKCFKSS